MIVGSLRRAVSHLLAALIFLQAGVAAGHCLTRGELSALVVEICSPGEGTRLARIGDNGREVPPESGWGVACPVCGAPAAAGIPEPPAALSRAEEPRRRPVPDWPLRAGAPPPARASPYTAHAPPEASA